MVDDSDDDRALFRLALRKAPAIQLLPPVADGEQAIQYLSGTSDYADRTRHPYPEVVLLDLKMPGKNGFDVLTWLRKQPNRPVIVVLSGSDQQCDIDQAFALGADYYHVKPSELSDWIATALNIESYGRGTSTTQRGARKPAIQLSRPRL
jgi:CheY-like chemotaxis protein